MFTKRNYLVGIIIFVAVWVLILAVPKTQNILRSQIDESTAQQQYRFTNFGGIYNESEALKYMEASNDPAVKMTIFMNQDEIYSLSKKTILDEYDKLLKQYPKSLWLIKARLIATHHYSVKIPMDPELQKRIFGSQMQQISKKEYSEYLHEIPRALQITRYAEKLEPENSFYNWMEATFLFVQGKNGLAMGVLENGAHKKYFNDGQHESKIAAVEASKLIGRNLFEERFVADYSISSDDMMAISQTNMAAIWQGALAEQRGDQQQALKIYAVQLNLCKQMLTPNKGWIGSSLSHNLILNVWLSKARYSTFQKQKKQSSPKTNGSHTEERDLWTTTAANIFAKYAAINHRPDLSTLSKKLGHELYIESDLSHRTNDSFINVIFGINRIKLLFQYKWIGIQLLKSLELLVPLFLLISIPVISTLRKYPDIRSTVDQQIKSVNVLSGTLFTLCTFGFLLAFALSQGVSSYYYGIFSTLSYTQADYVNILRGYIGIYYWWIPFVACYVYCSVSTLWKCRKSTFVNETQETLAVSIGEEKLEKMSKHISIAHQIVWWIIVALLELFWFGWIVTTNLSYILIPLTLIISAIIWWFTKNVHLRAPAFFTGTYWLLFATWLQHSLAVLILIFTFVYGVTSWASLPLRHNANIQLNHVLKVGEVTALREALTRDKAQHSDENTAE